MKVEYLVFDIFILSISVLGYGLFPKKQPIKILPLIFSVLSVSIPFLVWDQFVTNHWWHFNSKYILGYYFGALPVEEVLFFFAVPISCLIIWIHLNTYIKGSVNFPIEIIVSFFSSLFCFFSITQQWWYSASVLFGLIIVSRVSHFLNHWIRKKAALFFLSLVIIATTIFNGYLTSRPIVQYEKNYLSQVYVGSIPIEDYAYGIILIALITMLYEKLATKKSFF